MLRLELGKKSIGEEIGSPPHKVIRIHDLHIIFVYVSIIVGRGMDIDNLARVNKKNHAIQHQAII